MNTTMTMTCFCWYTEIADTGLHWWWGPKHSSHTSEPLLTTGRASRERAAQTEEQVISLCHHFGFGNTNIKGLILKVNKLLCLR